jgi:hypothetical protein
LQNQSGLEVKVPRRSRARTAKKAVIWQEQNRPAAAETAPDKLLSKGLADAYMSFIPAMKAPLHGPAVPSWG